jgi:tripartite-type tricarboxylate transporter receptor subunit TctC
MRSTSRHIVVSAAAFAAVLCGLAAGLAAQTFPERTVSMIVPFAPGGAADNTGRILAESMSKHLGQSVIIENAGGAGGSIGVGKVKNAAATGYTIGLGHMGTNAASVSTVANLPYDPTKDFEYLGLVATTPNVMFVGNHVPVNTLAEFIAYAKTKGNDLKMGHNGLGSASHITCVLFFQLIGTEPTYVPYRGFGQGVQDILGGRLDGSCDLVASVAPHAKTNAVKVLTVATDARSPTLPNVPTSKEAGLPDFKAETWTGLFAPKGTPAPALAKLREAVSQSLADPTTVSKLAVIGADLPDPAKQGGTYMQSLVVSEVARWNDIMKKAGVQPQ